VAAITSLPQSMQRATRTGVASAKRADALSSPNAFHSGVVVPRRNAQIAGGRTIMRPVHREEHAHGRSVGQGGVELVPGVGEVGHAAMAPK
jgi:hypothetical protein